MSAPPVFNALKATRDDYLQKINATILGRNTKASVKTLAARVAQGWKGGFPIIGADIGSPRSMWIMEHWTEALPGSLGIMGTAQGSGASYESLLVEYLNKGFAILAMANFLNASQLEALRGPLTEDFDQYAHIRAIDHALEMPQNRNLRSLVGRSYSVKPDVIVARRRVDPSVLDGRAGTAIARYTPLLSDAEFARSKARILQAIVSCKFTLRSDRAQNVRTEAGAAMKSRRRRLPSIVVITMEPTVGRLESLALGTGELDMVYHSGLPELEAAMAKAGAFEELERLRELMSTRRIRDVSDLLFDVML